MSNIILWSPQKPVNIPPDISTMEAIANYSRQLTNRELSQLISALNNGDFEMGTMFLWQKTMTGLKKQLGSLGMDFVGELLDRSDVNNISSSVQVLTDYDALRLAEELGMFPPTQAMRLRNVLQIVAHFSESIPESEEEDERQMMPEEAMMCLRTCIQSVLGHDKLEGAIEFARFRKELEETTFTLENPKIQSLLNSPYFFQRTTLRVLLALAKSKDGAQLQHTLANASLIIPTLWENLLKPDRWMIGRTYAEVHSEGKKIASSGLRKILLSTHGFDYVPEDLRSRVFVAAADELKNTHFSADNFYNEVKAIATLSSLGTIIPTPALARCLTAILCVRLGNHWGRAWSAQTEAQKLLASLSQERWKYFLDDCLPGDETILEKLTDTAIATRWNELVLDYNLHEIKVGNKDVSKLLEHSINNKPNLVKITSEKLLKNLTEKSTN